MGGKRIGKRGQLTIFIIIAIVIAAVLTILFYPQIKLIIIRPVTVSFIEDCVKQNVEQTLDILSLQGGSLDPVNTVLYNGSNVEYLCYTNQYYETCSVQQPLLRQHIEREIKSDIDSKTRECVESFKDEMRKKGWAVSGKKVDVEVNIVPNSVVIDVEAPMALSREGERQNYNKIKVGYRTEIYDLIMITTSILNWEARYGDTNTMNYMFYYPNIKVEKYKQGDGSKVYILSHTLTGDRFMFASRSLSWPPGYITG